MSKVKIGEITDSCLGKMLDAEKNKGEYAPYLANINVRWGSFDVDNLSEMRFEDDEQERYGLMDGDLVMCEGGEPGRCAIWHNQIPNMKIQKALHRIRPHDNVDIRWLYYWFLLYGRRHLLDRFFTETTIKHLPGDKLKDIELDLPEKKIQIGIADVLTSLDEKIEHNQFICAELESMAKTLYDYWFEQFDFPDKNGKSYRTSGGKMVKNELTKELIPSGWERKELNKVCSFRNGINYDKTIDGDQEYRIINVRDISSSSTLINESALDVISLPSRQALKYTITEQDIIVARSGTPGATRVLLKPKEQTIFCGFIICCTPRDASMRLYLTHTLKRLEGTSATKTGGSILQNVSQDTLKSLSIIIPDENVVRQFNEIVAPWYDRIQSLIEENNQLSALRDWLLPLLMNGQAMVVDKEETEADKSEEASAPTVDPRFTKWLDTMGLAARGTVDQQTLLDIFNAMDEDDKQ